MVGEEEKTLYGDCACVQQAAAVNLSQIQPWWLGDSEDLPAPVTSSGDISLISGAVEGFCPSEDCENIFYMTMLLVGFVSFIGSTARVGSSIINLRVVEPQVTHYYLLPRKIMYL